MHSMRYTSLLLSFLACTRSGSQGRQPPEPPADGVLALRDTVLRRLYGAAFVDTLSKALDEERLIDAFVDTLVGVRPTVVHCPAVTYPQAARRAGVQGRVVLVAILDTLGHPELRTLRVMVSPHDSLTAAAMQTLAGCEFTPGRLHGRPVRAIIKQPFDFTFTHP